VRRPHLFPFKGNYVDIFSHQFQVGVVGRGARIERQCGPDSADIPTGERAVRRGFLHLLRDFSQSAILRHMSGNSADISKGYFEEPIGSLNPLWSASKSMILQ
jgi:hypothetical protein